MSGKIGLGLRARHRVVGGAAAVLAASALAIAGALGAGAAAAGSAGAATRPQSATPAAAVPWASVGTGWVLTEYSTGTAAKPKPTTLYLVSPSGAKYAMHTWKASSTTFAPPLVAWAGNKTEALLEVFAPKTFAPTGQYDELNMRTGKIATVTLAGKANPLGFTLPTGQQILGETNNVSANPKANIALARYNQAGKLVKALVTEKGYGISAVYSPNGTALAASAPSGLYLVSNAGGVLKKLPVPGVAASASCGPVRWWNPSTILATCGPKNIAAPQLWLIPANGAKPSALTPVRQSGTDLGDTDAWQLSSGLYLQSLGPCGTFELNKQAKNGSVTMVTVPGTVNSPIVVTANSSRLLIETGGCAGGGQLVWFNPGTHAEQWLFHTGAVDAIAYANEENGDMN
jgi:hypothetical protein